MNKIKVFGIGFLIIGLLIIMQLLSRPSHPNIINKSLEGFKNDTALMSSIGGFTKYQLNYNKNDLAKDSFPYTLRIIGKKKQIIAVGVVIDNNTQEPKIKYTKISTESLK